MKRIAIALVLLAAGSCAGILGIRKPGPHPFEHRAHVVRGVACVECHAGIEHAGDDSPLHLPDEGTCRRCHARPHDPRPCQGCHGGPLTAAETKGARDHVRFSHEKHLARSNGNCMRCHPRIARSDGPLRPTIGVCLSCHAHRDQFQVRDCNSCHTRLVRELRPPDNHIVHPADFLRSHGAKAAGASDLCGSCHRETFCASCHGQTVPALPSTLAFDDPFAAGMHRAGFRSRHGEEARDQPGLCATCHTERSCRGCHDERGVSAPADQTRANPHGPGWVGPTAADNEHGRAARRDPMSCASCHGGAGEALCVQCHRVGGVGGNPHPPGWSSRRDLREVPCRLCHVMAP